MKGFYENLRGMEAKRHVELGLRPKGMSSWVSEAERGTSRGAAEGYSCKG